MRLHVATTLTSWQVFGSNMVLQSNTDKLKVWGFGPAAVNVTVTLSNSTYKNSWVATSGSGAGYWVQSLPNLPLGAGPFTLSAAAAGSTTVELTNILAGDR